MTNRKRKFDPENNRLDGVIALILLMLVMPVLFTLVMVVAFDLGK